ncbi:MAG: pilin [Candidatus Paceibacterota bacterium]
MNKRILLILFLAIFLLSGLFMVEARDLEGSYPSLPGVITPTTTEEPIVLYLLYIYQISIAASAFLIFVAFIIGGLKYLFSTGNPAKMLDGKKRMQNGLLGFVIVLGSYMILNTISSGFIVFPKFIVPTGDLAEAQKNIIEDILTEQHLKELPLGALITSEYSASIFLDDTIATDTKVDLDHLEEYRSAFPEIKEYNSDFQGALHGRRLKRIWEVASSTDTMTTLMEEIADDIDESVSYAQRRLNLLAILAVTCNCSKCRNLLCTDPLTPVCPCIFCNNGLDPCGVIERQIMKNVQENVPELYEGYDSESPSSLIPCKTLELEYASKMLLNFAVENKYINSDDDTSGNSFIGSEEQKEMQKALEQCNGKTWDKDFGLSAETIQEKLSSILSKITSFISNTLSSILDSGDTSSRDDLYDDFKKDTNGKNSDKYSTEMNNFLEQKNDDPETTKSMQEEIEKRAEILAVTENSGNWDPTSTIPERDVVTNFNALEAIYNSLYEVKKIMNPYDRDYQAIELMTSIQLERIKADIQTFDPEQMPTSFAKSSLAKIIVSPLKIMFANSLTSISEKEIRKYSGDPATFYYENSDFPQDETLAHKPSIINDWLSGLFNVGIANAEESTDTLTEGLEDVDKTQCAPLVEIPIGDATDEALNLTKDILDQLRIFKDNIVSMPEKTKLLKESQKIFYEAADKLIETTENCKESCAGNCSCTCGVPVMIPCPTTGMCCGSCNCECFSNVGPICPGLDSAIIEFEGASAIMNAIFKDIYEDIQEMLVAFKKLNSEDIKEDKGNDIEGTKDNEYLGQKVCCIDKDGDGNCRDEDKESYINTDLRNYTLKEQLVRVQLLLNRSRRIGYSANEAEKNKSDYVILLEGLDRLDDKRYFNMAYKTDDFIVKPTSPSRTDPSLAPIYGYSYETYEATESGEIINTTEVPLENRYLSDLSDCGYVYESVELLEADQQRESLAVLLDIELVKGEFLDDFARLLDPNLSETCTPDPLLDCYYYARHMDKITDDKGTPRRNKIPFHCYAYIQDIKDMKYPKGTRIPEGGNLANNLYCCIVPHQPEKEL